MRTARMMTTAALMTLGLLAANVTPSWAGQGYESITGAFGGPCGSPCGNGQFAEPTGVAVNDETGDVYVVDTGDHRVEWFNSTGTYEGQFEGSGAGKLSDPEGIAIDNDSSSPSHGDVYVADNGREVIDKFSAAGHYEGQITGGKCESEGEPPPCAGSKVEPFVGELYVAADPAGNLWVYEPHAADGLHASVYEFNDEGSYVATRQLLTGPEAAQGFAVDSSGDLYVTQGDTQAAGNTKVYEFEQATGKRREIIEYPGLVSPVRLAILSASNRLLVDVGSSIQLFTSPLREFPGEGLSDSAGIAVNGAAGEGLLYATQRGADNVVFFEAGPSEAPKVLGESASAPGPEDSEATFSATIDPGNSETTYLFEYARSAEAVEKGEGTQVPGGTPLPAEFGDQAAEVGLELRPVTETFYYRVIATNAIATVDGPVEAYTKLPIVADDKVSELTSVSAMLEATVNPGYFNTTYAFEYGETPAQLEAGDGTVIHGTTSVLQERKLEALKHQEESEGKTICPGITPEGGGGTLPETVGNPCPVSAEISGLQSGVTYYYRVVAKNEVTKHTQNANKGAPVYGPIESVTPFRAPAATTGVAESITETTAALSGEVNPEGAPVTYYFAYVSEARYRAAQEQGASNPYAEGERTESRALNASDGAQAVGPVQADDLLPGETYHYALVATNQYGIQSVGTGRVFTTQASSAVNETAGGTGSTFPQSGLLAVPGSPPILSFTIPTSKPEPAAPKRLTLKQRLKKALDACKRDKAKSKRVRCEKAARAKYKSPLKKKARKK
jgi:hypothetical protein